MSTYESDNGTASDYVRRSNLKCIQLSLSYFISLSLSLSPSTSLSLYPVTFRQSLFGGAIVLGPCHNP